MKLFKHYVAKVLHRKVWLNAQLMGRINGSQTAVFGKDIAKRHHFGLKWYFDKLGKRS